METRTPDPAKDRAALLKIRHALIASPIMFDKNVGVLKDAIAGALLDAGISPFDGIELSDS